MSYAGCNVLREGCVVFAWCLRGVCVVSAWSLRGFCVVFTWHLRGLFARAHISVHTSLPREVFMNSSSFVPTCLAKVTFSRVMGLDTARFSRLYLGGMCVMVCRPCEWFIVFILTEALWDAKSLKAIYRI